MSVQVRMIVHTNPTNDAVLFMFNDGSTVWVCFSPTKTVNATSIASARSTAEQFLEKLPQGRREGKIDERGNVLESPVDITV